MRSHGINAFEMQPFCIVPTKLCADIIERWLIGYYRTQDDAHGYNLTAGGEGSAGFVKSAETRRKISEANKGHKAPNKGVPCSPETKAKLSEIAKARTGPSARSRFQVGHRHSPETRAKIAAAGIGNTNRRAE